MLGNTLDLSLDLSYKVSLGKKDTKEWTAIKRRLLKGKSMCVHVGWFRGNYHVSRSGITLPTAQIAKWNEEGHITGWGGYAPPRPFIRVGFVYALERSKDVRDKYVLYTQQVASGERTWEQIYERLGYDALVAMQKAIKMDIYTANSPLTVSMKGHGITLIDTGAMLNSVEYKVMRRRT